MPTYEYKCSNCGHRFEEFMAISDNHQITCPICNAPSKRLISAGGGIIFKGHGFYETDHRKPEYKAKEMAEKKS